LGERAQRALGRRKSTLATWTGDVARSTLVKRAGGRVWWGVLGRGGGAWGRSRSTLVKRWGAAGGLLSMEGHWNIGDKPQGLELTEAAEGDRAACTAVVDTWVGGCEKSAHGWSSRRLRCDETIVGGPVVLL
jgi:hypothetical protein